MIRRSWMSAVVCAAVVIGGGVVAGGAAAAGQPGRGGAGATKGEPGSVEAAVVGYVEVSGAVGERASALAWLGGDHDPSLRELVAQLQDVAGDPGIAAVVVRIKDGDLTAAKAEELGQVMDRIRKGSGDAPARPVIVFADAYEPADLILASHASTVVLQSGGAVSLPGMYMQEMYFADTLAWAGVKADFVQVGDYKGASEPMARSGPSPQWDQNINSLLDTLYGEMRSQIKAGRKLSDAQLDAAMEQAWMALGADAKKAGLIDEELDWPDMTSYLEKKLGREVEWTEDLGPWAEEGKLDLSNPFALFRKLMNPPDNKPKRDTIALVHIDGPIIDGDSSSGGVLEEGGVGSRTIRNALSDIEDDDHVKGVVLRIDSPGGSAVASEVIWQGVKRVAEKKPVWVSVGSMAASGGYYIAVSGQKIIVGPSSIVGSIGVVGGKLALGGLLEKLKVNVVSRSRGPAAGMMGSMTPWTEAERAKVRSKMAQTYELFTRRVTSGRSGIDLGTTAEGRLFAGQKAVEMRLADQVGSLDDAITGLASQLGLGADQYDVMDYPEPKSLGEVVQDMLGRFGAEAPGMRAPMAARGGVMADVAAVMREVVGARGWSSLRDQVGAVMQLRREPVLLVSPRVIVVK